MAPKSIASFFKKQFLTEVSVAHEIGNLFKGTFNLLSYIMSLLVSDTLSEANSKR